MASSTRFVLDVLLRRRLMITGSTNARTMSSMMSSSSSSSSSWWGQLAAVKNHRPAAVGLDVNNVVHGSTTTQKRWRHSGKIGNHLETLEEMAHRPEREAAEERRKKKKDRSAAKRKGKKGTLPAEKEAAPVTTNVEEEEEDEFDFEGEEEEEEEEEEEGEEAEPSLPDPPQVKKKMMAILDRFQESLKSIRGAEPTAEIFDDVQVNAYGSMTPLKAVGQVVIVSPTLAQITCFDPSVAKDVAKAIQFALELNPQAEEGGNVNVPLPRVTIDVRQQTAKQLKKKAESCKQRLRQIRRKAMDVVKKGKDGKLPGVSKDDAFANAKEIDVVVDSAMAELQKLVDAKMDSIMGV